MRRVSLTVNGATREVEVEPRELLVYVLREVGMPDVEGFYRRYVDGREPLPYEAVLPKAGLTVARQSFAVPFVGVSSTVLTGGRLGPPPPCRTRPSRIRPAHGARR